MTLTTLGLTGPQWITRLEKNGYGLGMFAKDVLNSPEYKPMKKGQNLEVAFVTVKDMGKQYATTAEIKAYAAAKGYENPSPEIALLMREALSDKEIEDMGVQYVAALHEPIKDSGGSPRVLYAGCDVEGRWVSTGWGDPGSSWSTVGAFAHIVPQVSLGTQPSDLDTESLETRVANMEQVMKEVAAQISEAVKKLGDV